MTPEEHRQQVERSLQTKFRKDIFSKFIKAIKDYDLIREGDRIAVCISGGKDSMLMAKLFQELYKYGIRNFEPCFLSMDPGYNKENRELIEANAKLLSVPVKFFETQIFDTVKDIPKSPCYLCARMRRGYLYSQAKELGCNKIALGHHYDDVIETILMGMLYGGQVQTMMPKLHSQNFEGMELIRPMYLIREEKIIQWAEENELRFLHCACRFTEQAEEVEELSKRRETKRLIRTLRESYPLVEQNIFRSVESVNLRTLISYKKDGELHHFLDDYENAESGADDISTEE